MAEISCENRPKDHCRILACSLDTHEWETTWADYIPESGGVPEPSASSRIGAVSDPGGGEALYARFASPRGSVLLRMESRGRFREVSDLGETVERYLSFEQLLTWNGQQIGLAANETGRDARLQRLTERDGEWQAEPVTELVGGDNRSVSALAGFHGALYAATVNPESGFELWKLQEDGREGPTWQVVVDNGAHRFVHNQQVFSMQVHDGALFLAAGTPADEQTPESKFFDYRGFEILRLEADGHWDLMVGIPRFSPRGIIVPFSGLGPGLDPRRHTDFGCWVSRAGRLVLGVMDEEGFRLWASERGEEWDLLPEPAFSDIYQVDRCRMYSAGDGLVLVLETTDLDGDEQTQIWTDSLAP